MAENLDMYDPARITKNFNEGMQELTNQINARNAAEIDFANTLSQIKLKNEEKLAKASLKAQKDALAAAKVASDTLFEKQAEKRKNQAIAEYQEAIKRQQNETDENYQYRKELAEKELKETQARIDAEKEARKLSYQDMLKKGLDEKKKANKKELAEEAKKNKQILFSAKSTLKEKLKAAKELAKEEIVDEDGNVVGTKSKSKGKLAGELLEGGLDKLASSMADFAKQLETQIDSISSKKSAIDTRLQGSSSSSKYGSYWDQMSDDLVKIAGVSPLIKQSDLADKISSMVGQGIAFNVEQRALMDVMKDKIATTFDAANGTLLRLVKIQQQDTTAGRLGMESALTAFLNNMYETTEYMESLAKSVKSSLEEAMSLMSGTDAVEFEYQVQKWLGSMSSVGMSDTAVQNIAGTLGKIAAGQLDGVTGGGTSNLVMMAASNAGLSIADMLADGLDDSNTNKLMNSMVDYLAKIYNQAGDSKIIQQQFADVYGLTASDLKAIANLSTSASTVARDGLTYSGAMGRLNSMANSMYKRTSTGELLGNAFDNLKYSMSAGIASSPALYATYKLGSLLKGTTGGISIPSIMAMGSGVDLNTTVADLMMAGALGGSMLSGIGKLISSGSNGGITGGSMLQAAKVGSGLTTVSRGTGKGLTTSGGMNVSESGTVIGNGSSSDSKDKVLSDANDDANSSLAQAKDESDETKLSTVDAHVLNIYGLLKNISDGSNILKVSITDGYVSLNNWNECPTKIG